MSEDFKVGDTVFLVYHERRRGPNREVAITKVGRKWIEINDGQHRFDREALCIDGGVYSSPGRGWLAKGEYEDSVKLSAAWFRLKRFVFDTHNIPVGVTEDAIRQAAKLLGMKDEQ